MRTAQQEDGTRNLTHFSPLLEFISFLGLLLAQIFTRLLSRSVELAKFIDSKNKKQKCPKKENFHVILLITSIDKFLRYRIDNRVTRNATLESSGFFQQIDFMSTAFVYDSNKCQKLIFHSPKSPYKASHFKIAKSCFRGFILTRRRWLVQNMES